MIRSITALSLLASLLLFYITLPWFALIPLVISMYIIFTNGNLQHKNTEWQFSRYHILFGLRCTLIVGLSLLMHVFEVNMLLILCSLIGIHMLAIRGTIVGKHNDEFSMFHIGYYFISCVLLRYVPVTYGITNGIITALLFPIITFLLYAGGSFFIHPLQALPLSWHYRTAVYFLISFLCSIILYFFGQPIIGRTAALILYTGIIWFLVYQTIAYLRHEKRKHVYAEDILAGKKVIQPHESARYSSQVFIARIMQKMTFTLRMCVVRCSAILMIGSIIYAFIFPRTLSREIIFLLLSLGLVSYNYANMGRHKIGYQTTGVDALLGLFLHSIFARILFAYIGSFWSTSYIFVSMARTIIHHAIAILLGKQSYSWNTKRKHAILYGYSASNGLVSIGIILLFSYLPLDSAFIWAVNLLYGGIVGTMIYFFSRSMNPIKNQTLIIDEE